MRREAIEWPLLAADPSRVEAWKLRAWVYGTLAFVALLVLWQSGALAGDPPTPRTIAGATGQGSRLIVRILDGRLAGFDIDRIDSRCRGGRFWRVRWYPSVPQGNVSYEQRGSRFLLHERPERGFGDDGRSHANLYMRGELTEGGGVTGEVSYTARPSGIECASGRVGFWASPKP